MSQIFAGLVFMHNKHIFHRDMKPENIIYDQETGIVKIIDFGFATQSKERLKVFCGTPSYMSPEITQKGEYLGGPADVWASGIVLFLMLTGDCPFKSNNEKDLFRKIQRGVYTYPKEDDFKITKEAKDLVKKLLTVDANNRITADEALRHPWITKHKKSIY